MTFRMAPTVFLSVFLVGLFLFGCSTVERRLQNAENIASSHGFLEVSYKTSIFTLYGQEKILNPLTGKVHIYIEGDGLSWARPNRISDDPTPKNPVALKLAAQDPYENVIYWARPCQFNLSENKSLCTPAIWTDSRMGLSVIQAFKEALERVRHWYSFEHITLVGYSGGGGIATLLAAECPPIHLLITIAGNLDPVSWTHHHGLRPLKKSLNPIDSVHQLREVPQIHFVGEKDRIIPPFLVQKYLGALGKSEKAKLIIVKGQNHHSGWDRRWKSLLQSHVFDFAHKTWK